MAVEAFLAIAGADHQLVLAAEQLEGTVGIGVIAVVVVGVAVVAGVLGHAGAAGGRVVAVVVQPEHVDSRPQLVGGQLHLPTVGEAVGQVAEQVGGVGIPVGPVGAVVGRALEVQVAAAQRAGQAYPVVVAVVVLVRGADGEGGVRAQVGFGDPVEHAAFAADVVLETVAFLVGDHRAAAQGSFAVQRTGNVGLAAIAVPGADAALQGGAEVLGRTLAHHVDRRRRVACALHQAGGTAHHFDAVEHGQVGGGNDVLGIGGNARRQAVVHDVVDVEAARRVLHPGRPVLLHGEAGDALHRVVEVAHALVVHALAGDHADRLRGLADRHCQLGRGAHRPGGVGAAVFGDGGGGRVLGGDHAERAEVDAVAGGDAGTCRSGLDPGVAAPYLPAQSGTCEQTLQCLARLQRAA